MVINLFSCHWPVLFINIPRQGHTCQRLQAETVANPATRSRVRLCAVLKTISSAGGGILKVVLLDAVKVYYSRLKRRFDRILSGVG